MRKYSYVDATPSRNHIATLQGAGWSIRAIAAATNGLVADGGIGSIRRGRVARVRDCTEWAILEIDPSSLPATTVRGTEPFVPKTGAVRRIQALLAIGWTHDHMTAVVGFQTGGFVNRWGRSLCLRSTHDKVAAMYRDLATRPGPSELTRQRAAKRGYASPAAWDDIDRDEAPDLGEIEHWSEDEIDEVMVDRILERQPRPRKPTHAECAEAYRRLVARGVGSGVIERDYGLRADRYATEDVAA